jgi:uncharacterized protein YbaR (Trm112 family)
MKRKTLQLLACPTCRGELALMEGVPPCRRSG